jgi:hypothetical protein
MLIRELKTLFKLIENKKWEEEFFMAFKEEIKQEIDTYVKGHLASEQ